MKVLIAGEYGAFCNRLALKFLRRKCSVYTISGSSSSKDEKDIPSQINNYDLDLSNDKISLVIDSVKPDVIIFLGAFDERYDFNKEPTATTKKYMTDLAGLLSAAVNSHAKCFIYLSTADVYGTHQNKTLTEDSELLSESIRDVIISQGESFCLDFNKFADIKTVVLRFSDVYGIRSKKTSDFVEDIFKKAAISLKYPDRPFTYETDKRISPIYISDAVDAIYKTALSDEENDGGIYNVASDSITLSYLYRTMAALLEVPFEPKPLIGEKIEDRVVDLAVDNSKFNKVYNYNTRVMLELGLKRMRKGLASDRLKEKEKAEKEPPSSSPEKTSTLTPFFENLFVFVMFVLISVFTRDVPILSSIDFAIIYIVIVSITFGLVQSAVAAALAIGFAIWEKSSQVGVAFNVFIDLDLILRALFLFIIAIMCGYVRDRMQLELNEKMQAVTDAEEELTEMYQVNESNKIIKDALSERLINYEDSLAMLYSAVDKLNELNPDAVYFSSVEVIARIMKTDEVSIYMVTGDDYRMCRLIASSQKATRAFKKSVLLDGFGDLANTLEQDEIFVNRRMNEGLPMMATPVFAQGKLVSIIMLWSIELDYMTLYNINRFLVLTRLISSAIGKAYEYTHDRKESMYLPGTDVLTSKAFKEILRVHVEAQKNNVSTCTIMLVKRNEETSRDEFIEQITDLVRTNDYVGENPNDNDSLFILLENTKFQDAKYVEKRIVDAGFEVLMEQNK